MVMSHIIQKKKKAQRLTTEEIQFVVAGFTAGTIADYQMSALLMAICFQGMDKRETTDLTMAMVHSGDMVDLSMIAGLKVDKHSTGGVGDKTTLIISPIVASLGVPVAKMSGRGLGHTGGTIDKLESIPGLQTSFTKDQFVHIVRTVGLCISGQSGNLAPADKKIYALRDVTATIDSIPLIAASIMSKKIAAGSDCILLDVKVGSGAFMKTLPDATLLAQTMVDIGERCGRKTVARITQMDTPLGYAIGNSLEMVEAIHTLQGKGPKDLLAVSMELAAHMLLLGGKGDIDVCKNLVCQAIDNGSALDKLAEMVEAQNGDKRFIYDPDLFPKASIVLALLAENSGYVHTMDAEGCGIASMMLGAGRATSGETIDHSAGIVLHKKTGDYVKKGQVLAELHGSTTRQVDAASQKLSGCYAFSDTISSSK